MFIEANHDEGGGDNWNTGALSHARLQSNHHHQQTNMWHHCSWTCTGCACLNASSINSAPLSKRSSTTVSVGVNPAAVRRRLTSSTTFCIHGWSSGAGYASLNHRRPCFRCRRSTCMEQSSSRSASIPDIYFLKKKLKSYLFNLSFPSVWLYHWLHHWLFCTEPLKQLVLHTPL